MNEFMSGRIRFGHVLGYRDADKFRVDTNEGASVKTGTAPNTILWIAGRQIPVSSLTSKYTPADTAFLYICCFMALQASSSCQTLDVGHLTKVGKKWGDRCIVVLDGMTFWKRLLGAAKTEDRLFAGGVEYYDPASATKRGEKRLWDKEEHLRSAFRKTENYEPEQEYRFVLERKATQTDEVHLQVPSLSDIAYIEDIST
ncbi:MAG: hypothetical protein F4Y74_07210 [Gemmatimonadales bacterium]|nr:hypothetical protein [Gemmatimonadales bacterium]